MTKVGDKRFTPQKQLYVMFSQCSHHMFCPLQTCFIYMLYVIWALSVCVLSITDLPHQHAVIDLSFISVFCSLQICLINMLLGHLCVLLFPSLIFVEGFSSIRLHTILWLSESSRLFSYKPWADLHPTIHCHCLPKQLWARRYDHWWVSNSILFFIVLFILGGK